MRTKKFADLKEGDKIYMLTPNDGILESSVVYIYHSKVKGTSNIKFYRQIKISTGMVSEENLKGIFEQEEQEKVHMNILVLSKDDMVTLLTKPPQVVCTSKEQIESWMKDTGGLIK